MYIYRMNSQAYEWDYERIHKWGYAISEYIKQYSDIYLLTNMYGNTGDRLIWDGTRSFLSDYAIEFKNIPMQELGKTDTTSSTILIPGSGALTVLFHEWLPDIIEKASQCFAKVIVLPSQIDTDVKKVRDALSLQNVFCFAREQRSYAKAKNSFPLGLGIDLAIFSKHFNKPESPIRNSTNSTLVSLRIDQATMLSKNTFRLNDDVNNDISFSMKTLEDWMQVISNSDSIVTDRMHIAVAAVMLKKELFYIDPHDKKISDYFRFTFGSEAPSKNVKQVDVDWICSMGYASKIESRENA